MAGWALGQAGLKTKTRKGLAALILGANMPDIDVFFGNAPWDPLAIHRGFTHGLVGGVLLMPPVLAGLLWLLDRWQISRNATFKSGLTMHFGWLVALSYLGAITHPLLDMLTTYSAQLFSPFSSRWYHADGLFIIDLWLWLVLAVSIGLSKELEAIGRPWQWMARTGVAITFVYIAANLLLTQQANAEVRAVSPDAQAIFASPPPARFWERDLVWRENDCYRRAKYRPFEGRLREVGECQPTNMSDPIVQQAIRSNKSLRKFLKWSILPQADVTRARCNAHVSIGDARYGEGRNSRLAREALVPLAGGGCPETSTTAP